MLVDSGPRVFAVDPALLPQLDAVELLPPELERIWLLGATASCDLPRSAGRAAFPGPGEPVAAEPVRPGDTAAILYTSGTTGPSKGVCCPQAQFYWWAHSTAAMLGGLTADDVLYTSLPLFHTNALNACIQALIHGARVRRRRALLGLPLLAAARRGGRDRHLPARRDGLDPLEDRRRRRPRRSTASGWRSRRRRQAELHELFRERFGVVLRDGFGMTETNAVIGARDGEQRAGTMGRAMPGYEVKVVDEDDDELPDGTAGELVLRADGAVRLRDRLLAPAGADGRELAQPLVPLRRPGGARPRRLASASSTA